MVAENIDLARLREPFAAEDIEWRVGHSGKGDKGIWAQVLAYVTNRAIQERLDEVCGPANWRNEFVEWHATDQLCGVSIRIDGEWVTKWDGAQQTAVESIKGGLSDAMKRAGVQWGIGRYLYRLPGVQWAEVLPKGRKGTHRDKVKLSEAEAKESGDKFKWFDWNPPKLPDWALPTSKSPTAPKPKPPMPLRHLTLPDARDLIMAAKTVKDLNPVVTLVNDTFSGEDLKQLRSDYRTQMENNTLAAIAHVTPETVDPLRKHIGQWVGFDGGQRVMLNEELDKKLTEQAEPAT